MTEKNNINTKRSPILGSIPKLQLPHSFQFGDMWITVEKSAHRGYILVS